ncbi:hypothetical protein ABDD95_06335 [Mucilaginibacter sp. PAMB04274]|uniref:MutS-related protein n=1 Tax=Mucilaginibacter sp. PAMB04274 TaxID=3138568 RepID=UPI0031F61967
MQFTLDRQTLADLAVAGSGTQQSLTSLFKPDTLGGQTMLIQLFNHPLADMELLWNRSAAIAYLHVNEFEIKFDKDELDFIEHYLRQGQSPDSVSKVRAVKNDLLNKISPSNHYYVVKRGVGLLVKLLNYMDNFFQSIHSQHRPSLFVDFALCTNVLLDAGDGIIISGLKNKRYLNAMDLERCDYLFRRKAHQQVKAFLDVVYEVDVYNAVACTAVSRGFSYPVIVDQDGPVLELEDLFHPFVQRPVTNNISFAKHNLCFVTGANMAGKSTLLKSIGVAVLLAHIGFPVPASAMKTSLFKGLFTTINLSDNINLGHSHFYAEVLRVKEIAQHINDLESIVVIFDELFRGTNVKDAYDASLAIIKALAQVKKCIFIVSTHIIEVAEQLQETNGVFFKCFSTSLKGNKAFYNYKLGDGVNTERLGMKIIEDENILAMLQASAYNIEHS